MGSSNWIILALGILLLLSLPMDSSAADTECDATGTTRPNPQLNDCRDDRRDKGKLHLYRLAPAAPQIAPEIAVHCTETAPHRACIPGTPDCSDEPLDFDDLAWARQQCRVDNAARKQDLWNCVDDGITFKSNTVANACPKKAINIHRRTDGSPCELLNGNELVDVGNSDFYTCEATGPGPVNMGAVPNPPTIPAGCCVLGAPYLTEDHWEYQKTQQMKMEIDGRFRREWPEHYLEAWSPARVIACNHPNTSADLKVAHHACLKTPKDIMVEGFSNPLANPDHQGPGWCNVTTGLGLDTNLMPQFAKDLASVLGYIASPKGILTPVNPASYDVNNGDYGCFTHRKNYVDHCSSLGDGGADHLGFAHSMGAIVASSFNIPFQQFGGSVMGPSRVGLEDWQFNHRNNCDPIPWVTEVGHRVALAFKAPQPAPGGAPGVDGRIRRTYRICSEMEAAGKQASNCVRLDGSYVGTPQGPSDCYRNGVPCTWAPWCGANPYQPLSRSYTGREDFQPMDCDETLTRGLSKQVEACFKLDQGLTRDALDCVKAVLVAGRFTVVNMDDHLFDGSGNGDGYRPLTGANWGEPRRRSYGQLPVCPDGWIPGDSANHSLCCTQGVPDGAACGSDGDCCDGLSCNTGRCEAEDPCADPPQGVPGGPDPVCVLE